MTHDQQQLVVAEFRAFLESMELVLDGDPIMDDKFHRVPVKNGRGRFNTSGSYIGHLDRCPAGYAKNFRISEAASWCYGGDVGRVSPEVYQAWKDQLDLDRQRQREERIAGYHDVAKTATSIWQAAKWASQHPYLYLKHVGPRGLRVSASGHLVVPMRDVDNKIWSIQFIGADNSKRFLAGGRKVGCYFMCGQFDPERPLLICEGVATGKTVNRLTGLPVAAAFDAGNLMHVAQGFRSRYPKLQIGFAADNDHVLAQQLDRHGNKRPNVGTVKAQLAAQAVGGFVIAPEFQPSDSGSDWNDLVASQGDREARRQLWTQMVAAGVWKPLVRAVAA